MFHGFFQCSTAFFMVWRPETMKKAVEHCFGGFSTVSAGEKTFQAAVPRSRPADRATRSFIVCA
jgi:hypothetical protein